MIKVVTKVSEMYGLYSIFFPVLLSIVSKDKVVEGSTENLEAIILANFVSESLLKHKDISGCLFWD